MSESSALPLFSPLVDPGPSFADVLRRLAPHQLPGAGITSPSTLDIPHGTTVVAIRFAGGVIMAGDRRATAGYMIASRRIEKVFPADDFSGVSIAGAAGPAIEMVKLFQVQLEHYEKVQGDVLSLEGKANQLGQLVRANLPAAMQGFAVVPLFAGFDTARERGRVFSYDVTGGRYEELDFQAQGSGSIHARNWIKAGLERRPRRRRDDQPRDLVAVRGRRRGHRHRRSRPRAPHLPDDRGDRHERIPRPHRRRHRIPQPGSPPGRGTRRPRVMRIFA